MNEVRCLCCGKILNEASESDFSAPEAKYHALCLKKFFGTKTLPAIELSKERLEELAAKSVKSGSTVAGVQKKLSLHLDSSDSSPRLTLVGYPAGYILKPESADFPKLPESEFVVMKLAELWKIRTVPNCLVELQDESPAYIARRIDRLGTDKLAMEDFCQLSGRLTEDKYKGSYEQCGKIIAKYSSQPLADKADFFNRLLFCYVTSNNDMHLKNFSLIEGESGFVLSGAYDLLPVQIVNPADTEEMALNLNGKKRGLKRNDFLRLAENLGLNERVAENLIARCVLAAGKIDANFVSCFLGSDMAGRFLALIQERRNILLQ